MLSKKIKELRIATGMTQKEFAEKLKLPNNTYRNYENGYNEPPFDILIKIADFHGVSTDTLLGRKFLDINFGKLTSEHIAVIKKVSELSEVKCVKVSSYIDGLISND